MGGHQCLYKRHIHWRRQLYVGGSDGGTPPQRGIPDDVPNARREFVGGNAWGDSGRVRVSAGVEALLRNPYQAYRHDILGFDCADCLPHSRIALNHEINDWLLSLFGRKTGVVGIAAKILNSLC
jgi:hypothetical protein